MNTIDSWEEEAKEWFDIDAHRAEGLKTRRILALIDLIRKKDEAMSKVKNNFLAEFQRDEILSKALELTENLK